MTDASVVTLPQTGKTRTRSLHLRECSALNPSSLSSQRFDGAELGKYPIIDSQKPMQTDILKRCQTDEENKIEANSVHVSSLNSFINWGFGTNIGITGP